MVLAVVVVNLEDCCQRHVALLHNLTSKKWYSNVYAHALGHKQLSLYQVHMLELVGVHAKY